MKFTIIKDKDKISEAIGVPTEKFEMMTDAMHLFFATRAKKFAHMQQPVKISFMDLLDEFMHTKAFLDLNLPIDVNTTFLLGYALNHIVEHTRQFGMEILPTVVRDLAHSVEIPKRGKRTIN